MDCISLKMLTNPKKKKNQEIMESQQFHETITTSNFKKREGMK